MSEDITSNPLPAGDGVTPSGRPEAVESVESNNGNEAQPIAKALSAVLGKEFDSDESALKSVKDTFKFVGNAGNYQKHMKELTEKLNTDENGVLNMMNMLSEKLPNQTEEPTAQPTPNPSSQDEIAKLNQRLEDRDFFDENPQYKEHKGLLEKFRGNTGQPLNEIVADSDFQKALNAMTAQHEAEQNQSVLHSEGGRLNQHQTKLEEAAQSFNEGNFDQASQQAVGAVVESILNSKN